MLTVTFLEKLLASDKASNDRLGYSVSLSSDGTTLAVGAPYEDTSTTDNGAVYTYNLSTGPLSTISSPTTLPSGSTTYGNGSSLVVNAPVTVPSGSTLAINLASLSQLTGTGAIVVEPGGSVEMNGKSQTVQVGTILKIKP